MPQDAIDLFDMSICGISFYGMGDWVIPYPDLSFTCRTELNCTIPNKITTQYISNLHKQATRCLHAVVHEMRLHERMVENGWPPDTARWMLQCYVADLELNVFLDKRKPKFPFAHPRLNISGLRLMYDIKCHLIFMAVVDHYKPGYSRHLLGPGRRLYVYNRKTAVSFHNRLIGHSVGRFRKYTKRGVTIADFNFTKYEQSGVLRRVDDVKTMTGGMIIFVRPDYYYNVEDDDDDEESYDPDVFYENYGYGRRDKSKKDMGKRAAQEEAQEWLRRKKDMGKRAQEEAQEWLRRRRFEFVSRDYYKVARAEYLAWRRDREERREKRARKRDKKEETKITSVVPIVP